VPRGLKIFAAFIVGLAVGEAASIFGYIIATNFFGVFDRDGGGAMGAIFILGPTLAMVAGIMAALVVARITRRP
jgi:hypothetical protein